MKEKLTRNIGLKIISIILAALLWLLITNVDDPIKQVPFYNYQVEILNADKITSLGKVYDITEGKTIDFTASARRTIADGLTKSDFIVTADLSKLSDVGAVPISIKCISNPGEVTIKSEMPVMKVNVEESEEKTFKVNVVQKGEPAKGWYVFNKNVSTQVRITGPKSKIEKIDQVVVEADVSDVAGSFDQIEQPEALDADGKAIDASNLRFSETAVLVNIDMYKTKEINLNIVPEGKPASGYVMTGISCKPTKITIAAADDLLNGINELQVKQDITGALVDVVNDINIQDKLPNGVVFVGDNPTVSVTVKIEKSQTKDLTVWSDDIEVRNKPAFLNFSYLSAGPITVKINGPAKEVENIDGSNLKAYIDLTGYGIGTYSVDVKAELNGNVSLANYPTINIQLMQ